MTFIKTLVRIGVPAVVLFFLQFAVGFVTAVLTGPTTTDGLVVVQYALGIIASAGVFAYVAWANPSRPYVTALQVGALGIMIGLVAAAVVIGEMPWWRLETLTLDVPIFLFSIYLGVGIGLKVSGSIAR